MRLKLKDALKVRGDYRADLRTMDGVFHVCCRTYGRLLAAERKAIERHAIIISDINAKRKKKRGEL